MHNLLSGLFIVMRPYKGGERVLRLSVPIVIPGMGPSACGTVTSATNAWKVNVLPASAGIRARQFQVL